MTQSNTRQTQSGKPKLLEWVSIISKSFYLSLTLHSTLWTGSGSLLLRKNQYFAPIIGIGPKFGGVLNQNRILCNLVITIPELILSVPSFGLSYHLNFTILGVSHSSIFIEMAKIWLFYGQNMVLQIGFSLILIYMPRDA